MTQPLFAASTGEVVRVALPVPADDLFDYAVPATIATPIRPGMRVRVRFRDRKLTGVVAETGSGACFEGELRAIEDVIDEVPVISAAMLEILTDAARDALCPIGLALATALPAGSAPRSVSGLALTPRGRAALEADALPSEARRALEKLRHGARPTVDLRRSRLSASLLADLTQDGWVDEVDIEWQPSARPATERTAEIAADVEVEAALSGPLKHARQQAALFRRLCQTGRTPVTALTGDFPTVAALLRALRDRGLVVLDQRPAPRDVLGQPLHQEPPVELTPDQADVLKPILDAIRGREARSFLLHGVTGSGKTEVYLQSVGEALRQGRQALVLVPEITLTHQILARLRGRFGDDIAVLHSGLRPGERVEQWQRLHTGSTPIAVGARSALFAPLENLGVIIIDEEHDSAYKNEEGFRYHARDLATRRAKSSGCPLLLGSATPSLETRYAADHGAIRRLVLPSRIGGRPLPTVKIVDLNREREKVGRGRKIILSDPLARAMHENLAAGGQTILLLNRRGFSTQIFCFQCGFAENCPNCDIALTYHATEQQLLCHYCNHSVPPPDQCSKCGAADTALLGLGTERVEEEVRTRFPGARLARLDRDTAQRRGFTEQVLRDLHQRRLDIVIGTQMVAKGHDFPGVRLVGVVLADIGLHLPDFRAAERTFQLLTQVAGRAGRPGHDLAPGRVIIQTYAPDHDAVRPVLRHDYEAFYARELQHRAALGYPPFGHLAHVLVSGENEARTREAATALAKSADPAENVQVLGPAPSPLARLRGRFRYQLLIKGHDVAAVHAAAARVRAAGARLPDELLAVVDTQPVNML